MTERASIIIDKVGDLVSDFMYYDRKEDSELPVDAIEDAVNCGEISLEHIIGEFSNQLYLCFGHRSESRGGQDG